MPEHKQMQRHCCALFLQSTSLNSQRAVCSHKPLLQFHIPRYCNSQINYFPKSSALNRTFLKYCQCRGKSHCKTELRLGWKQVKRDVFSHYGQTSGAICAVSYTAGAVVGGRVVGSILTMLRFPWARYWILDCSLWLLRWCVTVRVNNWASIYHENNFTTPAITVRWLQM